MLLVGHTTKTLQLAVCMFRNLHLMFQNEERRLGYEVTRLSSPTNETDFPISSLHWPACRIAGFKVRSTKAMSQTRSTFTHAHPAITHTTALLCMVWHRPGTPLGSQQSIQHLITLANSFQTLPQFLPGSVGKGPERNQVRGLEQCFSFVWVYISTHTLGSLQSHWSSSHWRASHLSSSYGFSFCPCSIHFTCSAGNALKLDICTEELKSSFVKRQ